MRLGLVGTALVMVAVAGCEAEPDYHGRKLSLWVRDLDAESAHNRRRACEVLGEMGPPAQAAVPHLVTALADASPMVREAAIVALAKIGAGAKPALEGLLAGDSPELRAYAGETLVMIDPTHKAAGDALLTAATALGNQALAGRGRAGLIKMGAHAVPLLLPVLDDPYLPVRLQAIHVLAELGSKGRAATERLTTLGRSDPLAEIRREALDALSRVGAREVVQPILEAATLDPDESVSSSVAFILNSQFRPPTQVEDTAVGP